ncbi:TonB-dependent receptor plug domain-containing protein [Mesonia ostreae]|uniref:TonB-dependent receptor plug domain-containing protein n=1 Tax=Mesonia ostreae TaxID=861110 RepID=A0ABU2KK82_9FLAO|nr:TonB-dependent receptor [Mesonia ostreae]MDT0295079.1 TonB-dependent receptor plug domain-containing protein [Mesonia ostreae]
MKNRFLLIILLLNFFNIQAQETEVKKETNHKKKDSVKVNDLEEIILTGQYNSQSVKKSVFEVQVITEKDIQLMAGNNLADVLTQTLNMNIIPQAGEGRSGIQQFGFNSEYVKILVDNVPIVGDEGFGNAIDISQINLDDIQQIEIIEGAMGVQYGSNAVTGVVNIITKKSAKAKWQITPYIQEETIGSEYGLFDEGRHIQSLKVGHNFTDKLYANVLFTRNDFQGFLNQNQGKNYFNPEDENDGLRGYEWLPKEQNSIKTLINYRFKNFTVFYKFEYFTEETNKYNTNVLLNHNSSTQTNKPTANDEIFNSDRFYHHLNATGKIRDQINFNISASYQEQIKNIETFTYTIKSEEKSNIENYDYNTRKGFFSRGTFNNFFNKENFKLELGYETTLDEGSASGLSSQNVENRTQNNTLNSYSFFASSEIKPATRLSLRPGTRIITSSQFSPQYAVSLSGKYSLKDGYQLRTIIGTAPKTPTFEQLYFYMVDSNHNVQGNENLNPEYGKSIFLHFKKAFWLNDYELKYTPKLSAWYLDVEDKIDLIITNTSPLAYQYNNIDLYKTWGLSLRNTLKYRNLSAILGLAFSGESKVLNSSDVYNDDFLYAFQFNTNLSYQVPKWNTVFSTFFKVNGPQYQFVSSINDDGETEITRGKLDGYGWLNTSIKKTFYKDLDITIGARNVLDITEVNSSTGQGGTHSAASSSQLLGYGRSFFVKLLYHINF